MKSMKKSKFKKNKTKQPESKKSKHENPYPHEVWQMARWIVGFSCEFEKNVPEKNPKNYFRVVPDLSALEKVHPEILKPILKINPIIKKFEKDRCDHEDGFVKAFAHEKLKKIYSDYSENKIDLLTLKQEIHIQFAGHISDDNIPKLYKFLETKPKLRDPVTKSRELISKFLTISDKNLQIYEKTKMRTYFGLNFGLEGVFRQTITNLFSHLEPETIEKMVLLFNADRTQKNKTF